MMLIKFINRVYLLLLSWKTGGGIRDMHDFVNYNLQRRYKYIFSDIYSDPYSMSYDHTTPLC